MPSGSVGFFCASICASRIASSAPNQRAEDMAPEAPGLALVLINLMAQPHLRELEPAHRLATYRTPA
jgi:hypothetical protein